MLVPIKRLRDSSIVPVYSTPGAGAMDLYWVPSTDQYVRDDGEPEGEPFIPYHQWKLWHQFETGVAMALPEGHVLKLEGRSGFANNFGVGILAGVVDSDYRGEVKIILRVPSLASWIEFQPKPGDRICQGLLLKVERADFEEVGTLPETTRGVGGLGSTGRR